MSIPPRWWNARQDACVECTLCVHNCQIASGKTGYCKARINNNGTLQSPYLGQFSSIAIDPIEKKPLYHFLPGTTILSLGSLGCTMRCPFCQNHSIAQLTEKIPLTPCTPEQLLALAKKYTTPSVAYTYNEPTLQAEYILAAGSLLQTHGYKTVLVTNGMMSHQVLQELLPYVDAFNIDIKTFSSTMYSRLGGKLTHVQKTVEIVVEAGKHVELTTLVVPGVSDKLEELDALVTWIAQLNPAIPYHISRYFPAHRFTAPSTPLETLQQYGQHAATRLQYVYIGNLHVKK